MAEKKNCAKQHRKTPVLGSWLQPVTVARRLRDGRSNVAMLWSTIRLQTIGKTGTSGRACNKTGSGNYIHASAFVRCSAFKRSSIPIFLFIFYRVLFHFFFTTTRNEGPEKSRRRTCARVSCLMGQINRTTGAQSQKSIWINGTSVSQSVWFNLNSLRLYTRVYTMCVLINNPRHCYRTPKNPRI